MPYTHRYLSPPLVRVAHYVIQRIRYSVLRIAALGALLTACNPSNPPVPPPAAASPDFPPLVPADPTGTLAPANAPALFTKVLKFRIPTGTTFELAENGWMLWENNTTQCGDEGCYKVLSRVDDGAGKTTWIIQAWPQAYRRFANQLKYIITDVSLNSSFSGPQLASKPETLLVSPAVGGALGGPPLPVAVPGTPEWAADNEEATLEFVTIGRSDKPGADAYYLAVDPNSDRGTLDGWKSQNGFSAIDDSQDDTKAYYFNAGDLALGRSMHMKTKANGDVAYYVSNFPTVNDAMRGTNLIATVAMEYSPIPPGTARVMKFFVYGANNARAVVADLDGNGAKFIPNLCIICHGGSKYDPADPAHNSPDVGARFLPFDLSSYQYSQTLGRNGQEAAFKQLNLGMRSSNRSQATEELIQKWYQDQNPGDLARTTQFDDAVPQLWLGHERLYLDVVRPGCRSCHVRRDPGKDFASFNDFTGQLAPSIYSFICTNRTMPNAKVNYQRFWLQHLSPQAGGSMVGALDAALPPAGVTAWHAGACPTP